jgi:hypothetical protein
MKRKIMQPELSKPPVLNCDSFIRTGVRIKVRDFGEIRIASPSEQPTAKDNMKTIVTKGRGEDDIKMVKSQAKGPTKKTIRAIIVTAKVNI